MRLRLARIEDSDALLQIYAQYIDTAITFEYVLPTRQEFAGRVAEISAQYPYLVCEEEGRLVGYAYAHRQMERSAYQWNAELSVYLERSFTFRGLGKKLYSALEELLRLQGVRTVYALVTLPNQASERLHRGRGFRRLGVCRSTGYKCGAWHDVGWFEKQILPCDTDPQPVRSIREIPGDTIAALLSRYC